MRVYVRKKVNKSEELKIRAGNKNIILCVHTEATIYITRHIK